MTDMTYVEQSIAQYFIDNQVKSNFSSKEVASLLYTSEATLSRFAKKCGYKGYRELIYSYERDLESEINGSQTEKDVGHFAHAVTVSYQKLIQESLSLLDTEQLRDFISHLSQAHQVKVLGLGHSGFAAREFQLRFMRIGLDVAAVTDTQVMKMTAVLADPDSCLLGFSLSGRTTEVTDTLQAARARGVYTALFTANPSVALNACCDQCIRLPSLEDLDTGSRISPQLPLLIYLDIIYTYYFANDYYLKSEKLRATLSALADERGHGLEPKP
ncbi:MurR/RpiR family transcriptional regulator [Oscillospiraceae bacterium HV4-5-C5C]|nr:MurR/RpiR family transcriptional regulator [Oscillospiraceae bacterium HV4-5-C5C]